MEENICRFISKSNTSDDINILNFVCETKKQNRSDIKHETAYKINIITNGDCTLYISEKEYALKEGDVFFSFPAMPYSIESRPGFNYMYISYIGIRAVTLMDKINITKNHFIFRGLTELKTFFEDSIINDKSILNLRCEGILLYSFSILGEQEKNRQIDNSDSIIKIKKYIDENFLNQNLSLDILSGEYAYNKKYISTIFKKRFGIGISQYITTLRIQYACALIEQGFTSVKDISFMCGFTEPLYFSKVFKSKIGIPPKEYIKKMQIKEEIK